MRILITGVCGFVGSVLARGLFDHFSDIEVWGLDNLSRPGSETNRALLRKDGVRVVHGDARCASDFEQLPAVDWVIDAAANPSVVGGVDGKATSRQIIEHNLFGTAQALEFAKTRRAGFILLSTSRVYSISALLTIPLREDGAAFSIDETKCHQQGVSVHGLSEEFSVSAPVSLYGATKLASEVISLEYGEAFGFPVWINRCGVLAGAGQFGTAEQGIISYWIHAHRSKRALCFTGFGCRGLQVRDVLHPKDLAALVARQIARPAMSGLRRFNIGGGKDNSTSLAQLAAWCDARFGPRSVSTDSSPRPFDVPWVVMDSSLALDTFGWRPERTLTQVLDEIATHAEKNPQWLEVAG